MNQADYIVVATAGIALAFLARQAFAQPADPLTDDSAGPEYGPPPLSSYDETSAERAGFVVPGPFDFSSIFATGNAYQDNQPGDIQLPKTAPAAENLSPEGLAKLKQREGFAPTPYFDHKGYSIGYGHLIKAGENLTRITEPDALDLLREDVAWAEEAVRTAVAGELTQPQFDALVSLAFNIGASAFRNSTLVRKLNQGDIKAAQLEFARWNRASGQVNQGLVARRADEAAQFGGSTYV